MSKKRLVPILFMLLVLSVSCSRKEEALWSPGTGGVTIDVTAGLPATKAEVTDVQLDPDDFKVEVINSDGVIFKRWNTFAEYKSQEGAGFQMNAGGPYLIRAVYGDSTASGFQALFYMGEQEFTVLPQQTTAVSVVCRMGNVRLEVEYGENIRKDYTDIRTTVYSDRGSVIFGQDCSQPGYIPAGELSVYVQLTDEAGERKYFRNGSSIIAAAGDVITLKIDTNPIEKENVLLAVNVDSSTDRKDVDVTLPSFMLPAGAPELTATFTEEGAPVSYVEGVRPEGSPFVVGMNVPAGIYGLKVSVGSPNQELSWASELDLVNLTQEQRSKLTSAGFTVPELYRSQSQQIDFMAIAMLVRALDGNPEQSLSIEVTDGLGKTAGGTWALAPRVASKSISPVDNGNVWARRVYNVTMTTDGNPDYLFPLIQAEGSTEWIRPEFTETVSEQTKTVTITGLNPGTKYSVRAAYVDNSNVTEEVYEFNTEAAQQVENAGFEEWSEWEYYVNKEGLFWGDDVYQTNYAPYKDEDSRWWDSNNSETTPGDRTNTGASYKSFPMVSYVAGHESDRAAQLMLIAISNTATSGTAPSPTVRFGKIFTGVYNGDQGRQFTSRPTKLCFWHKFSSYDSDVYKVNIYLKNGETVIGESSYTSSTSESAWKKVTLEIIYNRMDLKADNIYVEFVCGSDTGKWQYGKDITYGGNKTANVHGGSILTIDDIELIYE